MRARFAIWSRTHVFAGVGIWERAGPVQVPGRLGGPCPW
jgi:hypothetical protein